jgi:thioredoxin 1
MKVLTSEELRNKINSGEKFIVDMYSDWCGPCRMLGPIIDKYSEKLKNEGSEVSIYKFDIESDKQMAMDLNVRSIPTIKGFSNGEEKISRTGVLQEPQLEEMKQILLL